MITFNSKNFPDSFSNSVVETFLTDGAIRKQANSILRKQPLTCWLNALINHRFTAIDRAFVIWGALTLFIFSLAQFSSMGWTTQAVLDTALTAAGIATTSRLTWAIASEAKLRWVVLLWAGLISTGSTLTGYSIFFGNALILLNLCPLWLGLCAAGYGAMAIGMASRCFTAVFWVYAGAVLLTKGSAIATLGIPSNCQFFTTGLIMSLTLFFFSIVPWDRREA